MISPELEGTKDYRLMCSPPFPQSVFIESRRIDACMSYALKNYSGRIAISPLSMGFELPDLSFLRNFPWVEHLTIQNADMIDISAVSRLERLRYLLISGKPKQRLELASFPQLRELRIDWWPKLIFGDAMPFVQELALGRFAPATGDLRGLPKMPKLEALSLVQSRKLSLNGIDRFSHLRRLEVSYFPNLVDISPLNSFAEGQLEILEFENCPRLAHHDKVRVIRSLKRLAFNECGEIASLEFLNDMPSLESFSFVQTNVVDGNLTPCLRLQFAGFLDKRHYSHRRSDFPPATKPATLKPRY